MPYHLSWENEDALWIEESLWPDPKKSRYYPGDFSSLVNHIDYHLSLRTLCSFAVGFENLIIFSPDKLTTCEIILFDSLGRRLETFRLPMRLIKNDWRLFKNRLNQCFDEGNEIQSFSLIHNNTGSHTVLRIAMCQRLGHAVGNWPQEGF